MDMDKGALVAGVLMAIPAGLVARWLSYRVWRIVAFVVGAALGLASLLALGIGVPWLFDEVHAGHWFVGMMKTGIAGAVLGALHGIWRGSEEPDEPGSGDPAG